MNPHTRKVLWFTFAGILLAALSAFITQSWWDFLLHTTAYFLYLSILEILLRKIWSPLDHPNEEHINIWNWKIIGLILLIIIGIAVQYEHNLQLVPLITSWLLCLLALKLLKELIELNRRTVQELIREPEEFALDNFHGLDYGSGMAYNFFYGYLGLMLPSPGDERRGIREMIDNFASTNQVQFGARKLFILIPSSTYCPPSVADRSRFMEASGSLQWRRMNRAGVTARQYHFSVYKLWVNPHEAPIYVCVEYATPLLTLYEIINQNTEDSRLYERYRDRLVTNFHATLQMIIKNNRDCRDLVELIYFRDVDNDGNPLPLDQLDVGNLILERIN